MSNHATNTLTTREAALAFRVPHATIAKWVQQDKIRAVRVGTGGNPRTSAKGGKLVYHNLVNIVDVRKAAAAYHAKREAKGVPLPTRVTLATPKRVKALRKVQHELVSTELGTDNKWYSVYSDGTRKRVAA